MNSVVIDAKQSDDIQITKEPMITGVDVAAGGDYNVYVIKQSQGWIESFNRSNDTMTNVNEVIRIIDKYIYEEEDNDSKKRTICLLKPQNVFIDDIDVGHGVTDHLKEMFVEIDWEEDLLQREWDEC